MVTVTQMFREAIEMATSADQHGSANVANVGCRLDRRRLNMPTAGLWTAMPTETEIGIGDLGVEGDEDQT